MNSPSQTLRLTSLAVLLALLPACNEVAPSATSTLDPTAPPPTPVPTRMSPSPTPFPSPTVPLEPTTTPVGQVGPLAFPPNVNPLTGETVNDPEILARRPLAIKISNAPPCVRPQAGLSAADLVFEHFAEGGTTRFTAIYFGRSPGRVGSIRSARLIDVELPAMYDAIFAYAGSSVGVTDRLRASDLKEQLVTPFFGCPPFCREPVESTGCGKLEHTMFTHTGRLWDFAESKGLNTAPRLSGMVFNSELPSGAEAARDVTIAYRGSYVQWVYDEGSGRYYRRQDGAEALDANTNLPITAENVVVLMVNHVVSDIIEDRVGYDPATGLGGNYSVEIQLWGMGDAIVFRDGQALRVKWVRFERDVPLGLVYSEDRHVPLKPGKTWFQLVPLETPIVVEDGDWRLDPMRPKSTPFEE